MNSRLKNMIYMQKKVNIVVKMIFVKNSVMGIMMKIKNFTKVATIVVAMIVIVLAIVIMKDIFPTSIIRLKNFNKISIS